MVVQSPGNLTNYEARRNRERRKPSISKASNQILVGNDVASQS